MGNKMVAVVGDRRNEAEDLLRQSENREPRLAHKQTLSTTGGVNDTLSHPCWATQKNRHW